VSAKQIKWLILVIPTLTLTLWEYARHHLLMNVISMEVGNWLAPVIVFSVSITYLLKLFAMLETTQAELERERSKQVVLKEREKIARELHDGIAQSLFLLSVKMDQLEQVEQTSPQAEKMKSLRKTVHQVNEYVRQAISNLRYPTSPDSLPWMQYLRNMVEDFKAESGLEVIWDWQLSEEMFSPKEKVELYASIREALLNVSKHAHASKVWIHGNEEAGGYWSCCVEDDGQGLQENPFQHKDRYGLKILQERVVEMGWTLSIVRMNGKTRVEIAKGR
jgi:two-component system nitrate/nitrite sensor histidine kinase NarQ